MRAGDVLADIFVPLGSPLSPRLHVLQLTNVELPPVKCTFILVIFVFSALIL